MRIKSLVLMFMATLLFAAYPANAFADATNNYWMAASDGGVFSFGGAGFYGSTGGMKLNKPIVGMTGSYGGEGYHLVASDGGVFTFGDAIYSGSIQSDPNLARMYNSQYTNRKAVGIVRNDEGNGYWIYS